MLIFLIAYVISSGFVFVMTGRFVHAYFGINALLASVSLIISLFLHEKKDRMRRVWKWVWGLIWLAFFPNALYLITDFIHLGGISFYFRENPYEPIVYLENIRDWIALVHIFFGALFGVMSGIMSILLIRVLIVSKWGKAIGWGFLVMTSLLSSIGIYIGRFLRFNSWDLLRPIILLKEVFQRLNGFAVLFVLMFMVVHLLLFALFNPIFDEMISRKTTPTA